uniref:DUF1670 domain-containing protein n=1 Tax=Strongyloides stercoralis TaxID=6248 RepID=A0A0K0DTT3_STRER
MVPSTETISIGTFGNLSSVDEISNLFRTSEKAKRFLYDQGIFSNTIECFRCGNYTQLIGQSFRCERRVCRLRVSARDETSFSRIKVPLDKVLKYLYYFISGASTAQIITYLQINKPTIANLNRYTHQLLADAVNQSEVIIGGPGIIVEINESKFGKAKYQRDHRVEGALILGGV